MTRRVSLGSKIDKVFKLREEIRSDEAKINAKKEKLEALKADLIQTMDDQGIESSRGTSATVSITESIQPAVKDWDKFYPWLYKNKAGYLMFKRLSAPAYRELLESRNGRAIPGVESFNQKKLNILRRTS